MFLKQPDGIFHEEKNKRDKAQEGKATRQSKSLLFLRFEIFVMALMSIT